MIRFRAERDVMLSALAIVRAERVAIRHFLDTVAIGSVGEETTYVSITVGGDQPGVFECDPQFLASAIRALDDPKLEVTVNVEHDNPIITCGAGNRTVLIEEVI